MGPIPHSSQEIFATSYPGRLPTACSTLSQRTRALAYTTTDCARDRLSHYGLWIRKNSLAFATHLCNADH
jgi:hypothetical protein